MDLGNANDSTPAIMYDRSELVRGAENGKVKCLKCSTRLLDKMFVIKRHYTGKHTYTFITKRSAKLLGESNNCSTSNSPSQLIPEVNGSKRIKIEISEDENEEEEEDTEEQEYDMPLPTTSQFLHGQNEPEPRSAADPVEEMIKGMMVMFRGLRPGTQKSVMKDINSLIIDAVYSEQQNETD